MQAATPRFQTFGSALRWCREREKLTRVDLGELLEVHPTAIAWWEDGSAAPIKKHLDRLLAEFTTLREAPIPASRDIPKPAGQGAMGQDLIDALRESQMDDVTRRLLLTLDAQAAKARADIAARDARIVELEAELAAAKSKPESKQAEPSRPPPLRVVTSPEPPPAFAATVPDDVANARSPVVRVARLSSMASNGPGAKVWVMLLRSADEARMTIPEVLDAVGAGAS